MAETIHTSREMKAEIEEMVKKKEFLEQKGEFSPVTQAYAARTKHREDDAWDLVTQKIIQFLPDYLTDGLIHCSVDSIRQQEACRKAIAAQEKELVIRPGSKFPKVTFKTFYPYLEFILRAGPVDILKVKNRFKVEGSMVLKDARILFSGDQIKKISGTITVSMTISLCKGTYPIKIHGIEKPIRIE